MPAAGGVRDSSAGAGAHGRRSTIAMGLRLVHGPGAIKYGKARRGRQVAAAVCAPGTTRARFSR